MDLKIAEERSVSPASQAETEKQDGNILKGMRFLCAEDNELNAEILTELLKIEARSVRSVKMVKGFWRHLNSLSRVIMI